MRELAGCLYLLYDSNKNVKLRTQFEVADLQKENPQIPIP